MTKRWPVDMTAAFLLVFIASFLTWGTIRHHYTSSFMLLMEHPGLANRIISEDDLSNLRLGARLNQKASAWKTGFEILGLFYPLSMVPIGHSRAEGGESFDVAQDCEPVERPVERAGGNPV